MIRAPVRVRVAPVKISCKQCGREYTTGELAVLTLCESCGTELARDNIAVEAIQHIIGAQRPIENDHSLSPDVSQLAARISIKRFEIRPGAGNARHDSAYPTSMSRAPAAAWIKVA